jgi:hypothetical protein
VVAGNSSLSARYLSFELFVIDPTIWLVITLAWIHSLPPHRGAGFHLQWWRPGCLPLWLKAVPSSGTDNGSAALAADPFGTASQRSQEGNQFLLLRGAQVSKALSSVVCFTIVTLDCVVKRQ